MKIFTKKKATKIILLFLILIMCLEFILPSGLGFLTFATETTEKSSDEDFSSSFTIDTSELGSKDSTIGGELFKPIAKFLAGIADLFIKFMQYIFVGYGNITKQESFGTAKTKEFMIYYGPGTIFSGTVAGLDANFISPGKFEPISMEEPKYKNTHHFNAISEAEDLKTYLDANGYNTSTAQELSDTELKTIWKFLFGLSGTLANATGEKWEHNGKSYYKIKTTTATPSGDFFGTMITTEEIDIYEPETTSTITAKERTSTAADLQEIIATWYKRLRTFSIVALLSILVYVGIRIVLSSTGQDKSKYKKMLTDWFVALCLLFVLQYIMTLTMTAVDRISDIFSQEIVGTNGEDLLMTEVRSSIGDTEDVQFTSIFAQLIIYIVLVVWTGVFTVHYLKRLIYLAFFTMIAPLISFTYPLDKIKDGQAQAFNIWIREYIFNALLPLLHLVLYSIFVTTAMAANNWILAIVAIGFMIPAEKFFRKMFGFDKASSTSQVGAAAGGAMIMNAVNKMQNKATQSLNSGTKDGNVRTTGSGGSDWQPQKGTAEQTGETLGGTAGRKIGETAGEGAGGTIGGVFGTVVPGVGNEVGAEVGKTVGKQFGGQIGENAGKKVGGAAGATVDKTAEVATQNVQQTSRPTSPELVDEPELTDEERLNRFFAANEASYPAPDKKMNFKEGLSDAFHERFNQKNIKNYAKKKGKKFVARGIGALGAVIGAGVGVATGDPSKAMQYAAAGGIATSKMAEAAQTKVGKEYERSRDVFKKAAYGSDEYTARQNVKELKEDWEFNKAFQNSNFEGEDLTDEDLIRKFAANGIVDQDTIVKAMKARNSHLKHNEGQKISSNELMKYAQYNEMFSAGAWGNPQVRTKFLNQQYDKMIAANIPPTLAQQKVEQIDSIVSSMKG